MRFVGWKEATPGFSPHLRHARSLRRLALQLVIAHAVMQLTRHMTNIRGALWELTKGSPGANERGSTC